MARSPVKAKNEGDVTPKDGGILDFDNETLKAIAEVYLQEGDDEYSKNELNSAIYFYTEGIKASCKDDELNAKLYSSRATANLRVGNYKESRTDAEGAIKFQTNNTKAIEAGASACVKLHLYEEATTWCDKGLKIEKENKTLLDLRSRSIHEHSKLINPKQEKAKSQRESYSVERQNDVDLTAAEDLRIEIRNYESIIKLCELSKDMDTKGSCLLEIGVCYYRLGDFEKAIHYFDLYLEIVKEMGDRNGEGVAYGKLGIAYSSLGDLKTSIHYQKLRLEIAKESGNIDEEGLAYNSLGLDYTRLGYFKEAIHYQELFLENSKKVENGTGVGVVRAYGSLGNNYHNLGDFKKAVKYHELSLKIAKEAGDREGEGSAYCGLGNDYESLGDFEKAIQYCELGLDVFKELGDSFEEGRAYGYLGSVFYRLGDSEKAIKYNQLCLANARCVGDTFREGETCNSLGCIFTSLGSLPQAGHYFQSSLKALSDARARLHFEDEWKINLNHVYQDVCSNLWNLLLDHNKVEEALVAAEQGRAQALKDLMEFKYKFKVSHDAYGSNTLDEATVATLASQPENTVTVFVAFAQQRVYFWIIEKGKDVKLRSYKNSETNFVDATTLMTSLRETAFETIGARDGVKCEDRSFDKQRDEDLADQKPNQSLPQFLSPQSNPLQTLYNVFIGPIADLIRGRKEIIIVPEGPLSLVPFVALITPNSKYLCESLRIRLIPSLTSLKLITNSPKDYHCNTGALLVGDPWVQEVVTYKLKQLPCAREEVEMIARILNTDPLIGEEATKDEVLKRLSTVALVHIAAHGRMENGEIALAPNLSRSSQTPTEEDFILTMTDVLHAKLRAKLVVLSCCHSGRGEIKSEGVVGIARAFLGAGTRSVLVSLWAIDDKATLEFMKSFYKQLVEGRSAGESLKRAMKSMRESLQFSEVKHWASFVLIGDDVTLDFGGGDDLHGAAERSGLERK